MSLYIIVSVLSFTFGTLVGVAAHCYFSTASVNVKYYRSQYESLKDLIREANEQCEVLAAAAKLDAVAAKQGNKEIKSLRRKNAQLKKSLRRRRRIFKVSSRGARRNKYKPSRPRRRSEHVRISPIAPNDFYVS